jgi:hypothetical protein
MSDAGAVVPELSSDASALAEFGVPELEQAAGIIEQYRDRSIGVADASNVVLADRSRPHPADRCVTWRAWRKW